MFCVEDSLIWAEEVVDGFGDEEFMMEVFVIGVEGFSFWVRVLKFFGEVIRGMLWVDWIHIEGF